MQIVTKNKTAKRDHEIISTIEVGMVLNGDEVKALRAGRVNLKGSYVKILHDERGRGELFAIGTHMHTTKSDPYRTRKLLARREEIQSLIGKTTEKGLTLIPMAIYFHRGRAKLEVGLARGLKKFDKREKIKNAELNRRIRRLVNKK